MLNPKQRNALWKALLIVQVVATLGVLSTFLPIYGDICAKDEYTGQKNCASYHIFFVLLWHVGKFLNDYAVLITGVATVLLAIITYLLVSLGREQTKTTQAQLRAYVFIKSSLSLINGEKINCELILHNSGPTPAYKLQGRRDTWVDTYPNPSDISPPSEDDGGKIICLGPQDNITLTKEIDVSHLEQAAIQNGDKAVWTEIEITYEDTFGRKWETKVTWFTTQKRINEEDRRMSVKAYSAT